MNENHPDEVELLLYVEDDLERTQRARIGAHLAACARCREELRRLETARDALRAAPLLELPAWRKEAILERLTKRGPPATPFVSVKRLVAVLTPVAAVLAIVFVVANSDGIGGGGDDALEEAASPAQTLERATADTGAAARADAGGGGAATAGGDTAAALESAAAEPVVEIAGPPGRVARVLREAGFAAEVVDGAVEVRGARRAAIVRALAGEEPGDVPVRIR